MQFTTSWDDGHPRDLRLAALLERHKFQGTFYIPNRNIEGLEVLSNAQLKELQRLAEVGSHTLDHRYLKGLPDSVARTQIRQGKSELEDCLGQEVRGFCYPGGRFETKHRTLVCEAGFAYARTSKNLSSSPGHDAFLIPTSFQLYPHTAAVYMRNWVKYGNRMARSPLLFRAVSAPGLLELLKISLLDVIRVDGTFHLWGHSWELDTFDGWSVLNEFLAFAADHVAIASRVCNADLRLADGAALTTA
jgi:peptidoglycan/xylan/chitin deacetylase (PgdA/CDA1 family)